MQWVALVELILKLLEKLPAIVELLRDLFAKTELTGTVDGLDAPVAVARVFDAARGELWWWQWAKRARLAVAEKVALRHAHGLMQSLKYGDPVPKLTLADYEELKSV